MQDLTERESCSFQLLFFLYASNLSVALCLQVRSVEKWSLYWHAEECSSIEYCRLARSNPTCGRRSSDRFYVLQLQYKNHSPACSHQTQVLTNPSRKPSPPTREATSAESPGPAREHPTSRHHPSFIDIEKTQHDILLLRNCSLWCLPPRS
ncbi:hypothetical protein BDW75DRAFT_39421 [Aspergillus navahoensis]